jgi:AraC-like DNA-binding protein
MTVVAIDGLGVPLTARRPATARSNQRIVDDVRGSIAANPAALDLPGLAARLGHTPFHVSGVFRRLTGTTLIQHRNDIRVAAAIDQIADGQRLADVAAELGFADQSHLARVLRRSVQLAPGRIRDRLGNRVPRRVTGACGANGGALPGTGSDRHRTAGGSRRAWPR